MRERARLERPLADAFDLVQPTFEERPHRIGQGEIHLLRPPTRKPRTTPPFLEPAELETRIVHRAALDQQIDAAEHCRDDEAIVAESFGETQ